MIYQTLDEWRAAGRPAWEVTDVWEARLWGGSWCELNHEFGGAWCVDCGYDVRLVSLSGFAEYNKESPKETP